MLTEGQAERLFSEAFSTWFQEVLAAPPEGVRRSIRRASRNSRPGDVDEDGPTERLRRAGFSLTEWRDFREPWTREPFDRAGSIASLIELVHELADLSKSPSYAGDNLFVDTELLDGARRLQINLSDTLEQRLRAIVKAETEKRWLEDNRAALEAYNRRVAEHGLLSDSAGLL